MSRIELCKIIELPKISDPRGNLSFIEGGRHIPFEIKRDFIFMMSSLQKVAVLMPIENYISF